MFFFLVTFRRANYNWVNLLYVHRLLYVGTLRLIAKSFFVCLFVCFLFFVVVVVFVFACHFSPRKFSGGKPIDKTGKNEG